MERGQRCQLQGKTKADSYQGHQGQSGGEEPGICTAGLGPRSQHGVGAATNSWHQYPLTQRSGVTLQRHQTQDVEEIQD